MFATDTRSAAPEQPGRLRIRRRSGAAYSIVQMLQRPPERPTLYRPEPARAETFEGLKTLARRVHQLRQGRALAVRRSPRAEGASVNFAAFDLFALDDAGGETWLGAAAIQTRRREFLEAALRDAQPEDC